MVESPYLSKAIKETKKRNSTSYYIKHGVLLSVDYALCLVYGKNYSMKCFQSSLAIQYLLELIGIHSQVHGGAACFGRALENECCTIGWSGFWGDETHAWVVTEFRELIDLTISQLHIHPKSQTQDEAVPIIWYSPIDKFPVIIRYEPSGEAKGKLLPQEWAEVDKLKVLAQERFEKYFQSPLLEPNLPAPLLTGPESLQRLHNAGNRWLNK